MREDLPTKPHKNGRRRARWLATQLTRTVSLSPEQLVLVARWNEPAPDESERGKEPRSLRRSERGTVPEKITGWLVLLLLGLLVLIWLHYVSHGLLP